MKMLERIPAVSLLALIAFLSGLSQANADIVYSENADGLTAGSSTLQDSTDWSGAAADYGVLAGGSVFTSNHFELEAPDANFNFANWNDGNLYDVLTLSIDLADTGGGATNADAGVRLAGRRETGSAFTDFVSANTTDNTVVHYDVVLNTSGSAVLYEDGINSIAANTLEVWIDGVLASSGTANGSGQSIGFGVWSRRPDNAVIADNIQIRNTAFNSAAIPEPASASLIGLAVLGLAGIRRRS